MGELLGVLALFLVVVGGIGLIVLLTRKYRKSVGETWAHFASEFDLEYNGDEEEPELSGTYRMRPVRVTRKRVKSKSNDSDIHQRTNVTVQASFETPVDTPLPGTLVIRDRASAQMAEMVMDSVFSSSDFEVGRSDFDDHLGIEGSGDGSNAPGASPPSGFGPVPNPDRVRTFFDRDGVVDAFRTLQDDTTQSTRMYMLDAEEGALQLLQMENYDTLSSVRQNLDALVECARELDRVTVSAS